MVEKWMRKIVHTACTTGCAAVRRSSARGIELLYRLPIAKNEQPMPQYDAFVSYSRHDAPVVEPVVQLLRFGGRNVFWDRDIAPGKRWSEKIEDAIGNAGTLAVLWCCSAARSPHVKSEIELARSAEK